MEQAYDILATYESNYDRGPRFASAPPVVPRVPLKSFLGRSVRSRVGIAAGLLLNSKWIGAYAQRGFDLLTYKTVRSSFRPCYPLPNWVFVEEAEGEPGTYHALEGPPGDVRAISSAVCFGMPSMAPEVWREDIRRARQSLSDGQLLIVSVVATPEDGWGIAEVAEDFVRCARWAVDSGADVIEANFSCPNVCSAEGSIYLDPDASGRIAAALRSAIGGTPLLIKTGYFAQDAALREYLVALDGVANGVTLVNCLSGRVIHRDGPPVFGDAFAQAGVLGRAIHPACVESVRRTRRIIDREELALEIAAVGGVSTASDVADFFDAGADAVLLGSAPMYLPNLAAEWKGQHAEW